jgi:hypothetical protein
MALLSILMGLTTNIVAAFAAFFWGGRQFFLKVVPELLLLVLAAWAVFLLLEAASFHEKWKRLARRAKLGETHQTFGRALHHEF